MNKAIKQQLSYKQQQKLSPQQIQQVKLLELTSLEIENRINQELEENPALEEFSDVFETDEFSSEIKELNEKDSSLDDYLTEDDIPDYKLRQNNSFSSTQWEMAYSESESFREYLLNQLKLKDISEEEIEVGEFLIGNMGDDGYIRHTPQALSDDMTCQYGHDVSVSKIIEILKLIQELDPPGIGASSLQECLLLQLRRKTQTPVRCLAVSVLEKHFDIFAKRHYDNICKIYNISEECLKDIIKEITFLNPKPGNIWESNIETKLAHIIPDFIIETVKGELVFTMPKENIPNLRINKEYDEMLIDYTRSKNHEKKEAITFVKQKIDLAQWFIDAVKQRNITLYNTMLAIIKIQQNFFLTGEEQNLKPMKLKDVSELCGYDISTVSRATINKYIQTDWGIYPLRFFFSEAMVNEGGEEVSTREIKFILKSCVENENKISPLTDDALAKMLKEKGYDIARRTIAKYREQLNIPVARLRKEIG